ncbi:O14J1 protein, partial [Nothocercus julius]|nr:O14J1 protein [Nothocercus julius]
ERMTNSNSLHEFLLLPFGDIQQVQLLHFSLFLGIYLAALLGNSLIITAVACKHRLHIPMYFSLFKLSLLNIGIISTTVPKSMANSLSNTKAISYLGCAAQIFFFLFFLSAECSVLTVMAHDHCIVICRPSLHYEILMGRRACIRIEAAAQDSGFLNALLHAANTFSMPLCQGNVLDQFFCEIPQMLKLSYS